MTDEPTILNLYLECHLFSMILQYSDHYPITPPPPLPPPPCLSPHPPNLPSHPLLIPFPPSTSATRFSLPSTPPQSTKKTRARRAGWATTSCQRFFFEAGSTLSSNLPRCLIKRCVCAARVRVRVCVRARAPAPARVCRACACVCVCVCVRACVITKAARAHIEEKET